MYQTETPTHSEANIMGNFTFEHSWSSDSTLTQSRFRCALYFTTVASKICYSGVACTSIVDREGRPAQTLLVHYCSPLPPLLFLHASLKTRGIRNPGVRQCLGFCIADFWSSLAYKSAEQKPKHRLTPGFLILCSRSRSRRPKFSFT